MLVREVVEPHAAVRSHLFNLIGAFFAGLARHYFGTERDKHLRPCPNMFLIGSCLRLLNITVIFLFGPLFVLALPA